MDILFTRKPFISRSWELLSRLEFLVGNWSSNETFFFEDLPIEECFGELLCRIEVLVDNMSTRDCFGSSFSSIAFMAAIFSTDNPLWNLLYSGVDFLVDNLSRDESFFEELSKEDCFGLSLSRVEFLVDIFFPDKPFISRS